MQPLANIYRYLQNETQKTLVPLFSVCGISSEEQEVISLNIAEIVLGEITMRIIQQVSEEQKKIIVDALNSGGKVEDKFEPIHDIAESNLEVVEIVGNYLSTDLPIFLSGLVETYLNKATEEQRNAFDRLATFSLD